jgi:hypothetical protein
MYSPLHKERNGGKKQPRPRFGGTPESWPQQTDRNVYHRPDQRPPELGGNRFVQERNR